MTNTKKLVSTCMAALAGTLLALTLFATPAHAAGYLDAAKSAYGIKSSNVTTVSKASNLESALKVAGSKATASKMQAVYVKPGAYYLSRSLRVPANVVLIAERNTYFAPTKNMIQLFEVEGSVYGGYFKGKNMANYALRFATKDFGTKGKCGRIERAVATGATYGGITASGNTKNAIISRCIAFKCAGYGIGVLNGAHAAQVSNNKIYDNSTIGIFVNASRVGGMKTNNIYRNGQEGITVSSNSTVTKIAANDVRKNKRNGMYISAKSKVTTSFSSNKFTFNGQAGINIDQGAVVRGMAKNKVKGNSTYNLLLMGSGTQVYLGGSNTFANPGDSNIVATSTATITFAGGGNKILSAPKHGVYLNNANMLHRSGSGNVISSCNNNGIFIDNNSTCSIANTTFKNIGQSAVYVTKGSTFSHRNCGLSSTNNAANEHAVIRV